MCSRWPAARLEPMVHGRHITETIEAPSCKLLQEKALCSAFEYLQGEVNLAEWG